MLENAFHGGRRSWFLLGILTLLIVVGLAAYSRQYSQGLCVTGMSRDVSWGLYISQFTFMVGVAASAVMVVLPYYLHDFKAFGKMVILGEFLAVAAIIMCMTFVFVDLGQPTRVLNVLLYPNPSSLMFWDICVLSGYLMLNLVIGMVTLESERKGVPPPRWVRVLIYISIPWAVSIHTVTAFLYSGLGSRPYWMTAILAPRFLASAFASGPALLILVALTLRRFARFDAGKIAIAKLSLIATYALIINLFFVLVELFTGLYSGVPHDMHSLQYLFVGLEGHSVLVPWIWACEALTVVCIVLLLNPKIRRKDNLLAMICVGVIAAVWIEKGLAMVATGFVPSPLGVVNDYVPTGTEIAIALGIYALGGAILTLLYTMVLNVRRGLEPAPQAVETGHEIACPTT
jgi:molybdopterin-containing oxidoreductase family membrane subunit